MSEFPRQTFGALPSWNIDLRRPSPTVMASNPMSFSAAHVTHHKHWGTLTEPLPWSLVFLSPGTKLKRLELILCRSLAWKHIGLFFLELVGELGLGCPPSWKVNMAVYPVSFGRTHVTGSVVVER